MKSKNIGRRDFLQKSVITVVGGLVLTPIASLARDTDANKGGPGFLIPTMLDEIRALQRNYKVKPEASLPTATELVEKIIELMAAVWSPLGINFKAIGYKRFQDGTVAPRKNTPALNGLSVDGKHHYDLVRMDTKKASTAVHTQLDLAEIPNLPTDALSSYCDAHIKQVFDNEKLVRVKPMVNNPKDEWFEVLQLLDIILYNPTYWCYGLPTESYKRNEVNDDLRAKIYNKNQFNKVLKTTTTEYYSQHFSYSNQKCAPKAKPTETTFFWGYNDDPAIYEYFELKPSLPCGDPSVACQNPQTGEVGNKPNIIH